VCGGRRGPTCRVPTLGLPRVVAVIGLVAVAARLNVTASADERSSRFCARPVDSAIGSGDVGRASRKTRLREDEQLGSKSRVEESRMVLTN
jgi:hypothetical protein